MCFFPASLQGKLKLPYFPVIRWGFRFAFQTHLKNLDPSYQMDLDFQNCFRKESACSRMSENCLESELQWLEHLWYHEDMIETGVVRVSEC